MRDVLFEELTLKTIKDFPDTRYQGSKLKVINWIWEHVKKVEFTSVLDAFGGTGSVSYLFKTENKEVTYNDVLKFNCIIGKALIENNEVTLTNDDVVCLLKRHSRVKYRNFIATNFKDIYFTDDENDWVDMVIQNIETLDNAYKRQSLCLRCFSLVLLRDPITYSIERIYIYAFKMLSVLLVIKPLGISPLSSILRIL